MDILYSFSINNLNNSKMRNLFFLSMFLLVFFSCKKDESDDTSQNNQTYDNYFPLKIGNYWVYQYNKLDSNGITSPVEMVDSIAVDRDTIIQSKSYFILAGINLGATNNNIEIVRDSNGYWVNQDGYIYLTAKNFTSKFNIRSIYAGQDTLLDLYDQMEKINEVIDVPAGNFNVINKKTTVTYRNKIPGVDSVRYSHSYFSKNVGNIYSMVLFYSNPTIYEKKLLRYKIN